MGAVERDCVRPQPGEPCLLSIAAAARVSVALLVGGELLGDRHLLRNLWLLPFRDLITLGLWVWCYAGSTVQWRGHEFTLKDGKMLVRSRESV